MMRSLLALALLCPAPVAAQAIQPGNWDVKSTAVDLVVPGAPGFLMRMMRGKSKTEHKCIGADQARGGVSALLVPDAKSRCRVDSQQVADGRIAQVLICPQKDGRPMRIERSGTFNAAGYAARMTMSGQTAKGAMRIVADQTATRTGPACRK